MSELLEIIMIVSFGVSWPLNVLKLDIRNKTNDGVEIETANSIYKLTYEDKFQLPFAG